MRPRQPTAFTLVELLVATAILAVMLLLIFSITKQAGDAWQGSAAKIESFQSARAAFESMTRKISQATLQTYYDYFDKDGRRRTSANASTFVPGRYGRYSDLHFVCGKDLLNGNGVPKQITHSVFFQGPGGYTDEATFRGLDDALNGCGYFIEYAADRSRPGFLADLSPPPAQRHRYRLMQFIQPTQRLQVYRYDTSLASTDPRAWFTAPLAGSPELARLVAENIVALIVLPKRSEKEADAMADPAKRELAPEFEYDTRPSGMPIVPQPETENQLPPLVEIVLVAVDEASFHRLGNPKIAPDLGQSRLFRKAGHLEGDLRTMEDILVARTGNIAANKTKFRYQVFRTDVPIRAAKWGH